jgi:acetolactate synthase-1/2/3 large subunit
MFFIHPFGYTRNGNMNPLRPVFLIGAGCPQELADKLCQLNVPVLTTWQAADLIPEDSPVFCGRPGVIGMRASNIIQQKCNWLMCVGARLDMEQVGHDMDNFAPRATKTVVDVDPAELHKYPITWGRFLMDLRNPVNELYGSALLPFVAFVDGGSDRNWLRWCKDLYNRFRPELDGADVVEDFVDPYYFTRILSDVCEEGEILVPGSSGMQSCALMQAFKVKRGQRIVMCNTIGAMGLEPMAIGAASASGRRVICVTGDGGFYQNFQELEVVKRLDLNIKYFVFCNGGYGSISTMQDARFNERVGSDPSSGFTVPDLARASSLWGFDFWNIRDNEDVAEEMKFILQSDHASIVRVNTSLAFRYACKVQSSLKDGVLVPDPMEDMTPKIPPDELKELMNA